MNSFVNAVRNSFESNEKLQPVLNWITQRWLYRKFVHWLFLRKTDRIKRERRYSFGIEVTTFCNANCTFCPNSKMERVKNVMSVEMLAKIIERIKDEKIIPTRFNLTGTGEPLIDKTIFEKIEMLKTSFPETEVYFPTNLALANEVILNKLVDSKLDKVTISLNANNAADYKRIMRLDYDKTIANLENLIKLRDERKSHLKIYITLAANPVNKPSIDEFLNRWEGRVDGVVVNWIHSWAGAVANGDAKNKPVTRYPCRPLFEQIIIHSNGNIPLCLVDYEGKVVGGNVMTHKILEAFNAPNISKIREMHKSGKINQIKMCSQCRFSERGLYWLLN